MRPTCKRVAVIGCGFSGISAVKALKEEGITPICFEQSDRTGGVWCYRDEVTDGLPSLMWSTTINHSKELGTFSDFPMPKENPNYLKHTQLYKNFLKFAEHFDLLKHVTCNREVISVIKSNDYNETGRWLVTVKNTKSNEKQTELFDGVMVCTGLYKHPKMAKYPGMDKFQGEILHTHSLKKVDKFYDKNVVIVGTGASAIDAAVEISSVAKQVYLSVRTPSWVQPRVGPYGLPFDYAAIRRFAFFLVNILPIKFPSEILQNYISVHFNYSLYGMKPKYPILGRDPIVNDILPTKILCGSVLMRQDIKFFTEDGVMFCNENEATKVDTVIMGTGYDAKFPFLENGILKKNDDGKINLYKCIYPTQFLHPTLAMIGYFLPFGAMFPLIEIQARWTAYMLSRGYSLPSENIMEEDVENRYKENRKRYSPSANMTVRVDYIRYMDEIASQFGVKPNFWKMLFTDPELFTACIFGACVPFQYRLEGPHKWEGAREAILTSPDRVRYPLSKEEINIKKESFIYKILSFVIFGVITSVICETTFSYYFLFFIFLCYFLIRHNIGTNYFYTLQALLVSYYGLIFMSILLCVFIILPIFSIKMVFLRIFAFVKAICYYL